MLFRKEQRPKEILLHPIVLLTNVDGPIATFVLILPAPKPNGKPLNVPPLTVDPETLFVKTVAPDTVPPVNVPPPPETPVKLDPFP